MWIPILTNAWRNHQLRSLAVNGWRTRKLERDLVAAGDNPKKLARIAQKLEVLDQPRIFHWLHPEVTCIGRRHAQARIGDVVHRRNMIFVCRLREELRAIMAKTEIPYAEDAETASVICDHLISRLAESKEKQAEKLCGVPRAQEGALFDYLRHQARECIAGKLGDHTRNVFKKLFADLCKSLPIESQRMLFLKILEIPSRIERAQQGGQTVLMGGLRVFLTEDDCDAHKKVLPRLTPEQMKVACFFMFQFNSRSDWQRDWTRYTYIYHLIARMENPARLVEEYNAIKANCSTDTDRFFGPDMGTYFKEDGMIAAVESGQITCLQDVLDKGKALPHYLLRLGEPDS